MKIIGSFKIILLFCVTLISQVTYSNTHLVDVDNVFKMYGNSYFPLVKKNKLINRQHIVGLFDPISILPKIGELDEKAVKDDMNGWSDPIIKTFKSKYRNSFDLVEAIFNFGIHFVPGGQYDGKGRYLDAVYIFPKEIDIAFGLKFSSSAKIISVSNIGTKNMPIASVMIRLDYSIYNGLRTIQKSDVFYLTGEGDLHKVDIEEEFSREF